MVDEASVKNVEAFLRSPNGASFCEKGKYDTYLFAVKLPLGGDPRFSIAMAKNIYGDAVSPEGIFPSPDWRLGVFAYIDNDTGKYISCDNHLGFDNLFGCSEGVSMQKAVAEVEEGIRQYLGAMPDKEYIQAALTMGRDPAVALVLKEDEIQTITRKCRRAFVLDREPLLDMDPLARVHVGYPASSFDPARFALNYLKDKDTFIQTTAEQCIPALSVDMIHYRSKQRAARECTQRLTESPTQDLLNERDIRRAIAGKASVWATFAKGADTLRMSVPTTMFQDDSDGLNDWVLTEKERNRLRTFLLEDCSRYFSPEVKISCIVALEYKNKTIFRNDSYFSKQLNTQKPSLSSVIQDADHRAVASQENIDVHGREQLEQSSVIDR